MIAITPEEFIHILQSHTPQGLVLINIKSGGYNPTTDHTAFDGMFTISLKDIPDNWVEEVIRAGVMSRDFIVERKSLFGKGL